MTFLDDLQKKFGNENFLKYYGIFKITEKNEYIMILESGERNLSEILKIRSRSAENQYQIEEALHIMLSLAEDFDFLQNHGIANRDVKAENIILVPKCNQSDSYYYKISDFGIGCILPPKQKKIRVNQIKGCTKRYASPEVQSFFINNVGNEEYDPYKADVYSLGLLFLDILMIKHKHFLSDEKEKNNENKYMAVYPGLKELLNGMLAQNVENRLDFKDVIKNLKEFIENSGFIPKSPQDEKRFISEFDEWRDRNKDINERLEDLFKMHDDYLKIEHYKKIEEILEKCKHLLSEYGTNLDASNDDKFLILQKYLMNYYKKTANLQRKSFSNYEEALFWDQQYFKLTLSLNKDEYNTDTAEAYIALSFDYSSNFNLENEERCLVQAFKINEHIHGIEHEKTADSYLTLAEFYHLRKKDVLKSKDYYLKGHELILKLLGESSMKTSASYHGLGNFYSDRDIANYQLAEECYLKALQIRWNTKGKYNDETAISFYSLGVLYEEIYRDFETAENLFLISLHIHMKMHGEKHDKVRHLHQELAIFYESIEFYPKMLEHLQKCLDICLRLYEYSESTASAYFNLGKYYYYIADNFDKAEMHFLKHFEIREKVFGKHDKLLLEPCKTLYRIYDDSKRNIKNEEYYRLYELDIIMKIYGEYDINTSEAYVNLFKFYVKIKNFETAETFFLKRIDIEQKLNTNEPEIANLYLNLAHFYDNQDKFLKAEEIYLKCLEMKIKIFGEEHLEISNLMENIGCFYSLKKDYQKAEYYLLKSIKFFEKFDKNSMPEIIATKYFTIGRNYKYQKKKNLANEYFEEAARLRAEFYHDWNHPKVLEIAKEYI